ncbi:acetyltransferase [Brucella endophytica]|uniref:Acetyltransferase n=1 Tax=Brucella endophytica TaxID=1963359 RepID=A0A916WF78_9HYPH|nr:GNAT family N-acetyltransferase [Brucella endophytica]GGA92067.1 acetyltransferase [Brucella endophytica]
MQLQGSSVALSTDRLVLRSFVESDFPGYAAYHSLQDVYRYLYKAPPTGDALVEKFLKILSASFTQDGDIYRLAAVRKDDEALLGEVLLKLASKDALQGEVGYVFNPTFAGNGYATEAVAAVIGIGFSEFGFHRIFARLDAANKGSVGVVERLGLRREAHLIENDRFNDVWGDEYIYAVLAKEWKSRAVSTAPAW